MVRQWQLVDRTGLLTVMTPFHSRTMNREDSMKIRCAFVFVAGIALCGILPAASRAQDQSQPPTGRIGVTVALVDHYRFGDAPAVIVRHGSKDAPDVIVLPSASATPQALVSAALTAEVLMNRDGDVADKNGTFRVEQMPSVSPRDAGAAAKVIDAIRRGPERSVAGIGQAHSGVIFIPNAATRAFQKASGKLSITQKP
jgi:hypothetical protein